VAGHRARVIALDAGGLVWATGAGRRLPRATCRAVGAVGQGGLLYARVPQDHGSVSVVWGERSGQRCRLAYAIRDDAVQQVSSGTPHPGCRPGIKEK
ncbi:hypothetical protein LAN33_22780, partial [Mycobacterium tuberculosis]|nr:hypothetical protein [Mycobacterium tuberculosis]